jgi:hypothetical protein
MAPETRDFIQRLEALDPRLALVQNGDRSWSIFRVPENGAPPVCICRSRPDAVLSPEIIHRLQMRDTRGGHAPMEEIIRHNAKVQKDAEDREIESKFLAIDRMLSKSWKGRVPVTTEGFETML